MSSAQMTLTRMSKPAAASTKLAASKQDVLIDQQQSLELVQILLSATISSIMYLRDVFPESWFESRRFNTAEPNVSYKDFKDKEINATETGSIRNIRELNKRGISEWPILARRKSKQADKLLDWIDNGVADALKKKYLSSVQLAFFDGDVCRSNAIEIYTIHFTYQKVGVPTMQVQHSSENHGVTFKVAKDNLRGTMTRLIKIIQVLDDLPRRRTVSMQLTYNDSCPADYQPPGFIDCSDPKLLLGEREGVTIGTLDTTHHKVDLRYSVVLNKDEDYPTAGSEQIPATPPEIVQSPLHQESYQENSPDTPKAMTRSQETKYAPEYEKDPKYKLIWETLDGFVKDCNAANSHIVRAKSGLYKQEAKAIFEAGRTHEVAFKRKKDPGYKFVDDADFQAIRDLCTSLTAAIPAPAPAPDNLKPKRYVDTTRKDKEDAEKARGMVLPRLIESLNTQPLSQTVATHLSMEPALFFSQFPSVRPGPYFPNLASSSSSATTQDNASPTTPARKRGNDDEVADTPNSKRRKTSKAASPLVADSSLDTSSTPSVSGGDDQE